MKQESASSFYKGITAAWMREASYTSLKFGLYAPIKKLMGADQPDASMLRKMAAGGVAGIIGSFAGNPFDMLKTRMMAYEGAKSRGVGSFAGEIYRS